MVGRKRKLGIYAVLGFVVFVLILSVLSASYVKADDWDYRKQHVIIGSSSGSQVDYQIKLVVHYESGTDSGDINV